MRNRKENKEMVKIEKFKGLQELLDVVEGGVWERFEELQGHLQIQRQSLRTREVSSTRSGVRFS